MGFEVIYHYFSRNEDGKYNTEEKKSMSKKVGEAYEDISYDQVAATIISQLARRDIWIQDVEVFEYAKKQISFRESGAGIVLKNKKYSLDTGAALISETIEEAPSNTGALVPQSQPKPAGANLVNNTVVNQQHISFYVHYEPEMWVNEAKQKGLKFTAGKKYPVHRAMDNIVADKYLGQKYHVTDDTGKVIVVDEKYFVRAGRGLVGDAELGFSTPTSYSGGDARLSHSGSYMEDVPDIRQKGNKGYREQNIDHLLEDKPAKQKQLSAARKPAPQYAHLPVDNGIDHLLEDMPDIRKTQKA